MSAVALASRHVERVLAVRARTEALARPLSPEDQQAQSMPDASPTKWHLAHTTWFFEQMVLAASVPGYAPFREGYGLLFNSYYESLGPRHARPQRGLLTRPALDEVMAYRKAVDARLVEHAASLDPDALELGLQHEQQHQELVLTDVKHLFSRSPLLPAYAPAAESPPSAPASLLEWVSFGAGVRPLGADAKGFAFDNERPRHDQIVPAFELASRPVTCGEYAEFIAEGGYRRPELWLSDGWSAVAAEGWNAPLYWLRDGSNASSVFTLHGVQPFSPSEPVAHVSFYEADAYARFRGARLPTEAEWELAGAKARAVAGNFAESGHLHPRPSAPSAERAVDQLFGDVWEWTSSPYAPYPGFKPFAGAFSEYNGKFMCNQMVLRGGSALSPADHLRATYRNFFPPSARWQMSGIRLARWS